MKQFFRPAVKGTYGYITKKRTQVLIMTLFMFTISAALFIAGYVTTGSNQNLLTIVAVLGCLPASKSLVSYIMYFRASGCSESAKERIFPAEGELLGMYDMYFTSYKVNFPISHMVVEGKNICGVTEKSCDTKACEVHLETLLKQSGYKDLTIKIFKDMDKYIDRLGQLNNIDREKTTRRDDEIRTVLYDISL